MSAWVKFLKHHGGGTTACAEVWKHMSDDEKEQFKTVRSRSHKKVSRSTSRKSDTVQGDGEVITNRFKTRTQDLVATLRKNNWPEEYVKALEKFSKKSWTRLDKYDWEDVLTEASLDLTNLKARDVQYIVDTLRWPSTGQRKWEWKYSLPYYGWKFMSDDQKAWMKSWWNLPDGIRTKPEAVKRPENLNMIYQLLSCVLMGRLSGKRGIPLELSSRNTEISEFDSKNLRIENLTAIAPSDLVVKYYTDLIGRQDGLVYGRKWFTKILETPTLEDVRLFAQPGKDIRAAIYRDHNVRLYGWSRMSDEQKQLVEKIWPLDTVHKRSLKWFHVPKETQTQIIGYIMMGQMDGEKKDDPPDITFHIKPEDVRSEDWDYYDKWLSGSSSGSRSGSSSGSRLSSVNLNPLLNSLNMINVLSLLK